MNILGIRFGHDSAAALIVDGKIIADVAEERFTRIKNDTSFPINAISFCLKQAKLSSEDLDCLAVSSTQLVSEFPVFFDMSGIIPAGKKTSAYSKLKQFVKSNMYSGTNNSTVLPLYQKPLKLSPKCKIHLCEHHLAHAASACYTSGLEEKSLVVTMDGVGDGVSVGIWRFEKGVITKLKTFGPEASIGWFYGNSTEALGWRHASDEWKLMGLAPYGKPVPNALKGYHPVFKDGKLVRPHQYGEFGRWKDHGANHYHGKDSIPLSRIMAELGREDFSAEVQRVAEEQAFNIIIPWLKKEGTRNLCCAGGCFLNVKLNQKLWYSGELDFQWVYPNPGDAGTAAGAALNAYYSQVAYKPVGKIESVYLGPEYSTEEVRKVLDGRGIEYIYSECPEKLAAEYLSRNLVIGWFQGRMEAGPRALGNRSILMSPLNPGNKDLINEKIKYREPFRPFCPSLLADKAGDYLINSREELFMITSFDVTDGKRSKIPAVVHVDGTVRPQMVKEQVNMRYYNLIKEFGKITGENIVLNTSFNIKGEPIVCNPREAIKCFYDTGMDVLVIDNFIIEKPAVRKTPK